MDVLRGALGISDAGGSHHDKSTDNGYHAEGELLGDAHTNCLDELQESLNGVSIRDNRPTHQPPQVSDTEDDEPGPDLLISHQEDE